METPPRDNSNSEPVPDQDRGPAGRSVAWLLLLYAFGLAALFVLDLLNQTYVSR